MKVVSKKKAYLTIDDSPSSYTEDLIKQLKMRSIPAIFFIRGEHSRGREETLSLLLQEGFLLGNHSWSHPYFSKISLAQCREEIETTDQLLERIHRQNKVERKFKFFRFPFGDPGTKEVQEILREMGYISPQLFDVTSGIIDFPWSLDSKDVLKKSQKRPEEYYRSLEEQFPLLPNKNILLFHDLPQTQKLWPINFQFLDQYFQFEDLFPS